MLIIPIYSVVFGEGSIIVLLMAKPMMIQHSPAAHINPSPRLFPPIDSRQFISIHLRSMGAGLYSPKEVTNNFDPTSESLFTITTALPDPVVWSGGGIYISSGVSPW